MKKLFCMGQNVDEGVTGVCVYAQYSEEQQKNDQTQKTWCYIGPKPEGVMNIMSFQIASNPCMFCKYGRVFVNGFFKVIVNLVKKGLSLGIVLFFALMTLSVLNHGTEFLKSFGKARLVPVQTLVNTNAVTQNPATVWVQRPAQVAPAARVSERNRNVSANARDTLRETRYFTSELERFTRTLASLGK